MTDESNTDDKNLSSTLELLNKALEVEYSCVVHFPQFSNLTKEKEIQDLIIELGQDSLRHASIVAGIITELGGNPRWTFEPFPEGADLVSIFQNQLEKEKAALELHSINASAQIDPSSRQTLEKIAKDEENHIQIVNDILSRLTPDKTN